MKKVLIAEDESFNQLVLQDMLELFYPDLDIRIVDDGAQALEVIKEGWPDIVLSDVDMPAMNGIELVEAVRKELKSSIPMISVTAYAITGDREKLLMHGFDSYLSKPIVMEELQDVLDPFFK